MLNDDPEAAIEERVVKHVKIFEQKVLNMHS